MDFNFHFSVHNQPHQPTQQRTLADVFSFRVWVCSHKRHARRAYWPGADSAGPLAPHPGPAVAIRRPCGWYHTQLHGRGATARNVILHNTSRPRPRASFISRRKKPRVSPGRDRIPAERIGNRRTGDGRGRRFARHGRVVDGRSRDGSGHHHHPSESTARGCRRNLVDTPRAAHRSRRPAQRPQLARRSCHGQDDRGIPVVRNSLSSP